MIAGESTARSKSCLSLAEYTARVCVYLVLEIYRVHHNGLRVQKCQISTTTDLIPPRGKEYQMRDSDAMQHLLSSLSTVVPPKARFQTARCRNRTSVIIVGF